MNAPVNVAIIGAGDIAEIHVDSYQMFPDICQVRAIVDIYQEKADELIRAKGLKNARAYKDMEEALRSEKVDLVSICLPPSMHADTAVRALSAGCHVLVEKPMGNSLEECDRMLEASKKSGKLLSVVCQNRFKTPMQRVRRMIQEETAGKVKHAIINSLWWRGEHYYDLWWRGTWENEGGGCFTSQTVHHIDLLIWMLGMPDAVTAVMGNVAHGNSEVEDVGVAILEYPDLMAHIVSSIVDHGEEQEMIFQTERAKLNIPWKPKADYALPNGYRAENTEYEEKLNELYQSIPELKFEGHPAHILNVLKAILGEEELLSGGEEGRKTIELITAIYKASVLRKTVFLPVTPADDFYRKEGLMSQMPRFHQKTVSVKNLKKVKITLGRDVGK